MAFFLFLNAYGKEGGVLLFTVSPFGASSSNSGSTTLGSSTAGLGVDGLTSLPLLKVTTAFTSSFLGFGSLESSTHAFPLDWAVSEKEISLFLTPAAGLLALKLNTAGCHIFGRSQTIGYLSFY